MNISHTNINTILTEINLSSPPDLPNGWPVDVLPNHVSQQVRVEGGGRADTENEEVPWHVRSGLQAKDRPRFARDCQIPF